MKKDRVLTKVAKNGLPIFSIGGIHLASTYYPEKSAFEWAHQYRKIVANANVVILGLGCGYHVNAIAEICQRRVLVVERRPQIITWYYQNSRQQFGHLSLHNLEDRSQAGRWSRIQEQVRFPLVTLKNPYVLEEDRGFYHSLFEDLNGRSIDGVNAQIKYRAEQREIIAAVEAEHQGGDSLLSVNNVTTSIVKNKIKSKEADIWLALGELVQ